MPTSKPLPVAWSDMRWLHLQACIPIQSCTQALEDPIFDNCAERWHRPSGHGPFGRQGFRGEGAQSSCSFRRTKTEDSGRAGLSATCTTCLLSCASLDTHVEDLTLAACASNINFWPRPSHIRGSSMLLNGNGRTLRYAADWRNLKAGSVGGCRVLPPCSAVHVNCWICGHMSGNVCQVCRPAYSRSGRTHGATRASVGLSSIWI